MSQNSAPSQTNAQMDAGSVGNVQKSVSMFRGDVAFPLTFLQLSGPNNLDVQVSATYNGNVAADVTTWNQDAPTGLLGLGWALPLDHISLVTAGAASVDGGAIYVIESQGTTSPLILIGTTSVDGQTCQEFSLAKFQPWRILYFPDDERWEVTQQDGITYTYGGKANFHNCIQWAVCWDSWIGSSSNSEGASQIAAGWNLAQVKHYWGDTITFGYENDDIPTDGNEGPCYTRASRVSSVVDAYGRILAYSYGEKEPGEYQPDHPRGSNGYQERYETHYLSSLKVTNPAGEELQSVYFGYELASVIQANGGPAPGFVKRYLTSVCQYTSGSPSNPGVRLEYKKKTLQKRQTLPAGVGSLHRITYPSGAVASYEYGSNTFANRGQSITGPEGSMPRVWFGPHYIVVTWYNDSDGDLQIQAYSWSGSWTNWDSDENVNVKISSQGGSLYVVATEEFFAVTYLEDGSMTPALRLYRHDPLRFGQWNKTLPDTSFPAAATAAGSSQLVAGDDFVVFNPAGSTSLYRYSWSEPDKDWEENLLTPQASRLMIAARANYYVVMALQNGDATLTLYHHDASGTWTSTPFPQSPAIQVTEDSNGEALFRWSCGASFVVATFVSSDDEGEQNIDYNLNIYHWDAKFSSIQCKYQNSDLSVSKQLRLPPLETVIQGSLIGNLNNMLRYDGSEWLTQQLPCNDSERLGSLFAYGEDVGIASDQQGAVAGYAFDASRNAFQAIDMASTVPVNGKPPRVTATEDYMTVGTAIYFRDPEGGWGPIQRGYMDDDGATELPQDVNQLSIVNRGPTYLAYETDNNSQVSSAVLMLRNGAAYAPSVSVEGSIFADKNGVPGTQLCGENAFVTFEGSDLDEASKLYIYHVANGEIGVQTHYPVIGLDVNDGYEKTSTAYRYDTSVATFDDTSTVAQYARVQTFPGMKSPPEDGESGTFGYTENMFYNGMDPSIAGLFYPDETHNYYSLLSGNALYTKTFDSDGELVAIKLSRYRRFEPKAAVGVSILQNAATLTSNAIRQAFSVEADASIVSYLDGGSGALPSSLAQAFESNGYVLSDEITPLVETEYSSWILVDEAFCNVYPIQASGSDLVVQAGFCTGEYCLHEPINGLLRGARTFNRNAKGQPEHHLRRLTYGWESLDGPSGSPIYEAMKAQHLLTAVVEVVEQVNENVTTRAVTLYDNHWGYGETCWAVRASYRALNADASFSFGAGNIPDRSAWQHTRYILSRNRRSGVTEALDAMDVNTSTLFDSSDSFELCQAVNASAQGGELLYYGAEAYENNPGWIMQPGGAAPSIVGGTAHTGTQSIQLPPDPTSTLTLNRSLRPTCGPGGYVFTWWYQTDQGFDGDAGDAGVTVTVTGGGGSVTLPAVSMHGTAGAWQLASIKFDPVESLGLDAPPTDLIIQIEIQNSKSSSMLLVDELRLIPVVSQFSGQVVDASHERPIAAFAQSAYSTQTIYGPTGTACATASDDGSISSITLAYASIAAHVGVLSNEQPNFQLAISPAGPGNFQDFQRDPDWTRYWQGDADQWSVTGGALKHQGNDSTTLTLRHAPTRGGFGCMLNVDPGNNRVTSPLILGYGSDLQVAWIPGSGQTEPGIWRLNGDTSTDVSPGVVCFLGAAYEQVFEASLAVDGQILPELQAQLASLGVLLSIDSTISAVDTGQWAIDDPDHGQGYLVEAQHDRTLAVTCLTLHAQPLVLMVTEAALLFYAGTCPIFQTPLSERPAGPLTLSVSDPVGFKDILVFEQPSIAHIYQDGCQRTVQAQVLELVPSRSETPPAANCLVTVSRYDVLGRPALQTKTIRYSNSLFGYQASAITAIDPETGTLSGDCNDYYSTDGSGFSDDGGYPYSGSRYGDWPGAPVVENGLPGSEYAITSADPNQNHTSKSSTWANSTSDVFYSMGFCSGDYQVTASTDPNGNKSYSLQDKAGNVLAKSADDGSDSIGFLYQYNAAGQLTTAVPPNAVNPDGSFDQDVTTTISYDFLGRRLQVTTPDAEAPTRFAYDRGDQVRFAQDATGAQADTQSVRYFKYDRLGRRVQSGYVDIDWSALDHQADNPQWPLPLPSQIASGDASASEAPAGYWRQCWVYDGDATTTLGLGRLHTVYSNNGYQNEAADTTQTYRYGINGQIEACTLDQATVGGSWTTRYRYDAQGNLLEIDYPAQAHRIRYEYNSLGQLAAIVDLAGQTEIARYAYTATGAIQSEELGPASAAPLLRTYSYNSPGWITGLNDPMLDQTVDYSGAYDGRMSQIGFDYLWQDAPSPYNYTLSYDPVGQLTTAANSALASGNLGVASPLAYDNNGNILTMSRDSDVSTYAYDGTSNRVASDGSGGTFGYSPSGAIISASQAGFVGRNITQIEYDSGASQPRSLTMSGGPADKLTFAYDGGGRRVIKQDEKDGTAKTTLYVHGSGAYALFEQCTSDDTTSPDTWSYVYGPRGPVLVTTNGASYFVLNDYLGSTRALVGAQSGAVEAHYDYTPFGDILRRSGDAELMRYLYTGQEYDPASGLYNYRARLYDSHLGRFYALDPLGEFASPYCYVGNNPISFLDPSGMKSVSKDAAFVVHGIELGVSVLEIIGGIALCFAPLPGCRILGKALIGAGASGALFSVTHFGDTTLSLTGSGTFLRAEIKGSVFGAIAGLFMEGMGAARRSIKRLGNRELRTDATVEAFGENVVTGVAGDADSVIEVVGNNVDEYIPSLQLAIPNKDARHMFSTTFVLYHGIPMARSVLYSALPEYAAKIELSVVGAYVAYAGFRAAKPIVEEALEPVMDAAVATKMGPWSSWAYNGTSNALNWLGSSVGFEWGSCSIGPTWRMPSLWGSRRR